MEKALPTRSILILKIKALRESHHSRQAIADWSMSLINDDSIEITDRLVWKILKNLGAVDLLSSDRAYLYTDEDFLEWETELNKP